MYTVTHSKLSPITTLLNCSGVIPHRVVTYRRVKIVTITIAGIKYDMGESWGLQYGIINLAHTKRLVARHKVNGIWQQWAIVL